MFRPPNSTDVREYPKSSGDTRCRNCICSLALLTESVWHPCTTLGGVECQHNPVRSTVLYSATDSMEDHASNTCTESLDSTPVAGFLLRLRIQHPWLARRIRKLAVLPCVCRWLRNACEITVFAEDIFKPLFTTSSADALDESGVLIDLGCSGIVEPNVGAESAGLDDFK